LCSAVTVGFWPTYDLQLAGVLNTPIEAFILFLFLFLFTISVIVFTAGATNRSRRALIDVCGVTFANVIYFVLSATGIAAFIIVSVSDSLNHQMHGGRMLVVAVDICRTKKLRSDQCKRR